MLQCFKSTTWNIIVVLTWNVITEWSCQGRVRCDVGVRCKVWTRHALTSYHVIHAARGDCATILRVHMYVRCIGPVRACTRIRIVLVKIQHQQVLNDVGNNVYARNVKEKTRRWMKHRLRKFAKTQRYYASVCMCVWQPTGRSHTRESALRASIVSSLRLKTLQHERRRPYNIPRFKVLSRRLEMMEARSADSRAWDLSVF
jgi:hypothetical protein